MGIDSVRGVRGDEEAVYDSAAGHCTGARASMFAIHSFCSLDANTVWCCRLEGLIDQHSLQGLRPLILGRLQGRNSSSLAFEIFSAGVARPGIIGNEQIAKNEYPDQNIVPTRHLDFSVPRNFVVLFSIWITASTRAMHRTSEFRLDALQPAKNTHLCVDRGALRRNILCIIFVEGHPSQSLARVCAVVGTFWQPSHFHGGAGA